MGVAVRASNRHWAGIECHRQRLALAGGRSPRAPVKCVVRACPAKTRINRRSELQNSPPKPQLPHLTQLASIKGCFSLAAIFFVLPFFKKTRITNVLSAFPGSVTPTAACGLFPLSPFPTECRLELLLRNRRTRSSISLSTPLTTPHHITSHRTRRSDKMSSEIMAAYWQAPPMAR